MPAGFTVLTGNNHEFGEVVRAGGAGCVSAVSSVFPEPFVALAGALRRGDEEAAAAAEIRIKQAIDAVGGSIALLKAGLALRGLPAGPTRVALDPPTSGPAGHPARGGRRSAVRDDDPAMRNKSPITIRPQPALNILSEPRGSDHDC